MKYLIIFLILVGCTQEYTFEAFTNNDHVKNEEFIIKGEDGILEIGSLPVTISGEEGDVIVAEFEAHVSNFGNNHPQCNCEYITSKHWKCRESFEINGEDWEIAK